MLGIIIHMSNSIMEGFKSFDRVPRYLVSEEGKLWDTKRNKEQTTTARHKFGYPMFALMTGTKPRTSHKLLHRIVAETWIPNPDSLRDIDHIDGDPLNNHVNNLRWCSHSNNLGNRPGWKKRTYDLPKNVYKFEDRYRVQIMLHRKTIHGGLFRDLNAAKAKAEEMRAKYFGEYAHV